MGLTIHAEMLALQADLRDEDWDALFREDASAELWSDADYDVWLTAFLSDAYEAWLDDWNADVAEAVNRVADPDYVPFQSVATESAWPYSVGWCSSLADEIGYLESTAPYAF